MNTTIHLDAKPPKEFGIVLLVDDQPFVAEVLRRFLANEHNLMLHYCADPNEAIATAEHVRPTVILQDLVMPGIDGLALVSRFRANPTTKGTPIIVLSSKEDPETKSLAFSLGANDYLVKLPEPLEFVARVRYHSNACLSRRQRDEAFSALRRSQQQLLESNTALLATNQKLGEALSQVKQLRGLLPVCAYCKRVRDDGNYWSQIEEYLAHHSDLRVTHGICDSCFETQSEAVRLSGSSTAPALPEHPPRTGLTIAPADELVN